MTIRFDSTDEFKRFLAEEIVTQTELPEMLDCTRQYVHKLVKQGKLIPFKETGRERLFLKSDIDNWINRNK